MQIKAQGEKLDMVDVPTVHIAENSPEWVALTLLKMVASAEGREIRHWISGDHPVDRAWILDTYAECLQAVRGERA
jgi:hypothetical protein